MHIRVLAVFPALIWSSIAAAAPEAALQPVGNWTLDANQTQCAATRTYGLTAAPVRFSIVPSMSGGSFVLQVSEQEAGPRFAQEFNGTVDFGSGPISTSALYFGANGAKMRAHQFRIPAAQMEFARSASRVSLKEAKGANFEFALSDMTAVLDALRSCTASLRQIWNAGAKAVKEEKPIGDVRAIFTTSDLPAEAMQKQQPDRAQYQLLVDEKGAVMGCDILVPSGSALVDTEGCQLVTERAKFEPAIDALGNAVRSVWTSPRVTWRTTQEAFDNGCSAVNANGAAVNMCGRPPMEQILRNMPPPTPSAPPPSTQGK